MIPGITEEGRKIWYPQNFQAQKPEPESGPAQLSAKAVSAAAPGVHVPARKATDPKPEALSSHESIKKEPIPTQPSSTQIPSTRDNTEERTVYHKNTVDPWQRIQTKPGSTQGLNTILWFPTPPKVQKPEVQSGPVQLRTNVVEAAGVHVSTGKAPESQSKASSSRGSVNKGSVPTQPSSTQVPSIRDNTTEHTSNKSTSDSRPHNQTNPSSIQAAPIARSSAGQYAKQQEEARQRSTSGTAPSAQLTALSTGSRIEERQLSTSRVCIDHLLESPTGKAISLADIRRHMETTGSMVIYKDVRISQDHREQYPNTVRDKICKLTFFSSPDMLRYQLEIQGALDSSKDQLATVYVESSLSNTQDYGFLRLPRRVKAGETVLRLADWINSSHAMPNVFGSDDVCGRARTRIIGVALALAKEVQRLHFKNRTMCGSLSPQNIFLRETQHGNGETTYQVFIEDFSSTNIEDAFVAPWLKGIPGGSWWSSTVQAPHDFWNDGDKRLFRLAIKEADIWSMGAIFWALCEGGVSFMKEPYDVERFMRETNKRVDECWKWKFFVLTFACLQGIDGDEQGIPRPGLWIYSMRKICDILESGVDGEYEDGDDILRHRTQMQGYIEGSHTGLHQLQVV